MGKFQTTLFFSLFMVCISQAGIRILENTAQKCTFEWTTDKVAMAQSADRTQLSFEGSNIDLGENNEPMIPGYSFVIGVPKSGESSATFQASATHAVVLTKQITTRKSYQTAKRYPGLSFSPAAWLSSGMAKTFSGLSCKQFVLRPFIYDPATKTLQVLDKGVFTITFPPTSVSRTATAGPGKSDFARMLSTLIMNYPIAKSWSTTSTLAKQAKIRQIPILPGDKAARFDIGDGHNALNEGTINENRVIKIKGADLIRIFGTNVSLSNIALYASCKGEMDPITPGFSSIPDGLTEIPLLRHDNGKTGTLDTSEYVLAYVSSTSDWHYETVNASSENPANHFTYKLDRYDDYRHYWLSLKTSPALSLAPSKPSPVVAADVATSGRGHYLLKRSSFKSHSGGAEGGMDFAWTILTMYNPSFTVPDVTLPDIDATAPCSLFLWPGYSLGSISTAISYGNQTVCGECGWNQWINTPYPGDGKPFTIKTSGQSSDSMELMGIEFAYSKKIDMTGKKTLTVFSAESPGLTRYRLSGIGNDLVYLFRITNWDSSITLIDTVRNVANYEWTDTSNAGIRYYACTETGIDTAPTLQQAASPVTNSFVINNVRTYGTPIDYLIISHPDFLTPARKLATHKKNIGTFKNPMVLSTTDLYNQFSGGKVDPSAIRNCLAYIYTYQRDQLHDSSFAYVAFFGSGHYDCRGIESAEDPVYIPVAEIGNSCIEDFFTYLQSGEDASSPTATSDVFLGRFPCKSVTEATQMVDKVIQTEDPSYAVVNGWRNRILLVADDDMQGLNHDPLQLEHMWASENVDSITDSLAPWIDIRKTYLFDYPWNANLEKPEAAQSIVSNVNNGVAIMNYFGHGADNVWADEHVLMYDNIANMTNNGMYPIVNSFSCSVGRFDKPGSTRSLSEYLILALKSGAVATISATRSVYASDNKDLALNFYQTIFNPSNNGGVKSYGAALTAAKFACLSNNSQKMYSYLGDPSLAYSQGDHEIKLTLTADNGANLDTVKALQHILVKGIVVKKGETNVDPAFSSSQSLKANVQISMFNPPYLASRKDGGTANVDFTYKKAGSPIFIGQTEVTNGVFTQRILVPKNIAFDKLGAKLTAFAWHGLDIAVGTKNNLVFHGFDTLAVSDTSGPVIAARPIYTGVSATSAPGVAAKGASFTDNISASCPFSMEISISDSNGIDAVSTGPDEGITYEITGPKNQARTNINQKFQFLQGDYRRGSATIAFEASPAWPAGTYKIAVSAQDMLGNVSHKTIGLEITDDKELTLYHVFNYPNPMRLGETSKFYFDLSQTAAQTGNTAIRVMIRIYTLSGRLIRVFDNAYRGQEFDAKDSFGNSLSPGVYLYQIVAANDQKMVKSKIEKLAINPPR